MERKSIFVNLTKQMAIFICMLVSFQVQAIDCYEKSPGLIGLGDKYYELGQEDRLTRAEKRMLGTLYRKIEGDWEGSGVEVSCIGSQKKSQKRNSKYTIESDISSNSESRLTIYSDKYFIDRSSNKNETLRFFGKQDYFSIEEITERSFKVIEKYRKGKHGNQLWEVVSELRLENGRIKLDIYRYINGHFRSHEGRSLNAD